MPETMNIEHGKSDGENEEKKQQLYLSVPFHMDCGGGSHESDARQNEAR